MYLGENHLWVPLLVLLLDKKTKEALPSLMEKKVTSIVLHLKAIKNNTARKKDDMSELLPNVY